jgi:uncharacterized 2Fe-2S/4Fe-4S cluster protein (DUF4445 family)
MGDFYAAIDLGTTSVEVSLLRTDGSVTAKSGFANPQSRFGSDVISRMTYQQKHPGDTAMQDCLKNELRDTLSKMLSWNKAAFPVDLNRILVTCNTVMGSLLLGYDTGMLGQAPFGMPFSKNEETNLFGIPMTIPVGASAFLGSDACGGAWVLGLGEGEVLMDLGTNGEMIVCHDGIFHGASAACGPAFENCTRSRGIYGSTTISVLANLLRQGKLREDGVLTEEQARDGIEFRGIRITAKILHEIQLASAAIYATYAMLLKRAGLAAGDVKKICLAGGFGFHLSLRDAVTIGLIPEEMLDRVTIAGNTSLLASERMVTEGTDSYDAFRRKVHTQQLAGDPDYEGLLYSSMILGKRNL